MLSCLEILPEEWGLATVLIGAYYLAKYVRRAIVEHPVISLQYGRI
jgi:hypothetical protein